MIMYVYRTSARIGRESSPGIKEFFTLSFLALMLGVLVHGSLSLG